MALKDYSNSYALTRSSRQIRKRNLLDSLSCCSSYHDSLSCAIDKILELQDDLFELQQNYMELLINVKNLKTEICAPIPF